METQPILKCWAQARRTTLNAHYTAPVIVRAVYAALQRLGFTHGRILEPALGLGHFIGLMPDDMHSRSLVTGIEIDSVTARLAKLLYPDADVRHQAHHDERTAKNPLRARGGWCGLSADGTGGDCECGSHNEWDRV